jgi:hypothetical protein
LSEIRYFCIINANFCLSELGCDELQQKQSEEKSKNEILSDISKRDICAFYTASCCKGTYERAYQIFKIAAKIRGGCYRH